jgi:hypothetical protein
MIIENKEFEFSKLKSIINQRVTVRRAGIQQRVKYR